MNAHRLHLAILRTAALIVPREQRFEWRVEWTSELWYVHPARATAFCLGAFKDALWLRRNSPRWFQLDSPLQCVSFLALLAAASLLVSFRLPVTHEARAAENLVLISPAGHRGSTIRLEEYQAWNNARQRVFTDLAFYQPIQERLRVARHGNAELSLARASDNLFQLLNVPVSASGPAALILSHTAWREFFDGDPQIVGRALEIAGQRAVVAGVIPEGSWSVPGRMDAWLLEDQRAMAALPPESRGFVLARVRKSSTQRISVSNDSGGHDNFDCIPLGSGRRGPVSAFLLITLMSGLLLPVTTSLSLGDYPAKSGLRRWIFLGVKLVLILVIVYCGVCYVAYRGGADPGILVGSILAFRWAIIDQRRRCPVCLRLVTNPVRVGQPSQTFLEWYGTEFICAKGHGLLHVPEIPTSCYSSQRWLCLDGSWRGLF